MKCLTILAKFIIVLSAFYERWIDIILFFDVIKDNCDGLVYAYALILVIWIILVLIWFILALLRK